MYKTQTSPSKKKGGKNTLQDANCEHLLTRPELAWPKTEECHRGVITERGEQN